EQAKSSGKVKATKRSEIERWLTDILTDGPLPAKEIEARGEDQGYSESMLRRAKDALGIRANRTGFGANGAWIWTLNEKGSSGGLVLQSTLDAIDAHSGQDGLPNARLSHLKPLWRNTRNS